MLSAPPSRRLWNSIVHLLIEHVRGGSVRFDGWFHCLRRFPMRLGNSIGHFSIVRVRDSSERHDGWFRCLRRLPMRLWNCIVHFFFEHVRGGSVRHDGWFPLSAPPSHAPGEQHRAPSLRAGARQQRAA